MDVRQRALTGCLEVRRELEYLHRLGDEGTKIYDKRRVDGCSDGHH